MKPLARQAFSILKKDHLIYIEGHRGMNRKFYENTLKSFSQAISSSIDSIEFDVWLTKDKVPVIMHGGDEGQLFPHFKVDDKSLLVNNKTFEEMRKLEYKKDPEQKIPTLEEVLDLCKDKIFLNIEIKDSHVEETFDKVVKLLEQKNMFNQIDISSFNHNYHKLVEKYNKEHGEKIEFGYLYYDQKDKEFIPYKFENRGCTMNVYQGDVTKELVDKAHENGIPVMTWFKYDDHEDDKSYERLLGCNVDCICCNKPDEAMKYRDNVYYKKNKI
jgi:glycerophosphoryl diester phosphodiesterase